MIIKFTELTKIDDKPDICKIIPNKVWAISICIGDA